MDNNKKLIQLWGNNEKRQAFLAAYKDWEDIATTPELHLTYYGYALPGGKTIIAEEHKTRSYAYELKGNTWGIGVSYYVLEKDEPFYPAAKKSLWNVADLLKDAKIQLQQEAKKTTDLEVT